MTVEDADELVLFQDVRIIRASGPALLCGIGDKRVWLPRIHVSGKLWCTGDRGKLFIRRWVARDRRLIDSLAAVVVSAAQRSISRRRLPDGLHALRPDPQHRGSSSSGVPCTADPRPDAASVPAPATLLPIQVGETKQLVDVRQGTSRALATTLDARRSRRRELAAMADTDVRVGPHD